MDVMKLMDNYEKNPAFLKMKMSEFFVDINLASLYICRDMEGTCDECPFGVWNDRKQGYDCGFEKFVLMLKDYIEHYADE